MPLCYVPACQRGTAGYSRFCDRHRGRARRHGHPEQYNITAKRLAPYVRKFRAHVAKRGGEAIWIKLEAILEHVIGRARAIVAEYQTGRPGIRFEVQAASTLIKVAKEAPARGIIETVVAMMLLVRGEPGSFKSDRAVWVQTARRFRNLSDVAVSKYWNAKEGRTKRVYRNFPPNAAETLGRMLLVGFAGVAHSVKKGEEEEAKRLAEVEQSAYEALKNAAA